MMLVRRMSLKRPPQYQSPTKKMRAPTANPAATMSGEKPPTSIWSLEPWVGRAHELEERLRRVEAECRVDGDPRRRQEPDMGPPEQVEVAAPARMSDDGRGAAGASGAATAQR